MDAVEFIEESKRMCKSYGSCCECPTRVEDGSCKLHTLYGASATEKIELIEAWSAAHPRKTRQSVFLEQWPNAKICVDGVLDFCPQELDTHHLCKSTGIVMRCQSCRREFWMQEVE